MRRGHKPQAVAVACLFTPHWIEYRPDGQYGMQYLPLQNNSLRTETGITVSVRLGASSIRADRFRRHKGCINALLYDPGQNGVFNGR